MNPRYVAFAVGIASLALLPALIIGAGFVIGTILFVGVLVALLALPKGWELKIARDTGTNMGGSGDGERMPDLRQRIAGQDRDNRGDDRG